MVWIVLPRRHHQVPAVEASRAEGAARHMRSEAVGAFNRGARQPVGHSQHLAVVADAVVPVLVERAPYEGLCTAAATDEGEVARSCPRRNRWPTGAPTAGGVPMRRA